MKVCIYGAGAIGGWIGAHLAQQGCSLSAVARGATLEALQQNGLVLLQGGNALFADLVSAMDGAQRSVHLETYIFEFEGSALRVAEALERAALRGLNVRLVVDGIAQHGGWVELCRDTGRASR